MKKLMFFLFMLVALTVGAHAQAPQGIPYQAVARNSSGVILASTTISVRFTIRDSVATGTIKYRETFSVTTTAQGMFSVNVGQGTPVTGTFSGINWGTNAKFMQVEIDPAGGLSYIDMGTTQMMSVPYSIYSSNGFPVGSTGDLMYHNGTNWVKLPAGTAGQVLTMGTSGLPVWAASSGTGGGGSGGGGIPSYLPATGLVAWYPFTGNANDSSGNGNHGTVNAGTFLSTDRYGNVNQSYSVDGVNCSLQKGVSLPVSINNGGEYSFSIWFVSTDSTKTDQNIFNTYPHNFIGVGYFHSSYPAYSISSYVGAGGSWITSGSWFSTSSILYWHHLVVVKSLTDVKYYDNNNLIQTISIPSYLNSGTITRFNAGAITINGGPNCYEVLKGKIDDIAIYNRALTATEITQIYNGGVASSLAVGSSYGGGKVAYIFAPGDPGYVAGEVHGLIAAPSDQSTGIQWYNGISLTTGGTGTALGTGLSNTNVIVASQGSGSYAAKLCYDLVLGGYSDWYLPSKDELDKLYTNSSYIGGFSIGNYWSSSEYNVDHAFHIFFGGGSTYSFKGDSMNVRAVRSF